MPLAGEKLIEIKITIPWYGTMMDTYDYARECIEKLKGGTFIPDMKLHWTVKRVEVEEENVDGKGNN